MGTLHWSGISLRTIVQTHMLTVLHYARSCRTTLWNHGDMLLEIYCRSCKFRAWSSCDQQHWLSSSWCTGLGLLGHQWHLQADPGLPKGHQWGWEPKWMMQLIGRDGLSDTVLTSNCWLLFVLHVCASAFNLILEHINIFTQHDLVTLKLVLIDKTCICNSLAWVIAINDMHRFWDQWFFAFKLERHKCLLFYWV